MITRFFQHIITQSILKIGLIVALVFMGSALIYNGFNVRWSKNKNLEIKLLREQIEHLEDLAYLQGSAIAILQNDENARKVEVVNRLEWLMNLQQIPADAVGGE